MKKMNKMPHVKKASGEMEPFSSDKLKNSLKRSGANDETINSIVSFIEDWLKEGVSTKNIYSMAFSELRKKKRGLAARYSLKKAIMELGPSGYPFEHFVGQALKSEGYDTQVGQIVEGKCVTHEVDVVATANKKQFLVECKFYNSQGKTANVQVPLYIRSRVDDIINKRKDIPEYLGYKFYGMIVTNTRFTSDATAYGKCSGLHLLSWDYPHKNSLKDMVEKNSLFPITALTMLNKNEKHKLMEKGIVLCSQLLEDKSTLQTLNLTDIKKKKILSEAMELSNIQQ